MIRTLSFKKTINRIGEGKYEVVTDSALIETILDRCQYYGLKIIKVNVRDFLISYVTVWGNKTSFLTFVKDFVHKYKDLIEDIDF